MTYESLVHKLGCKGSRTTKELLDIVTSHASEEEVVGAIFDHSNSKARATYQCCMLNCFGDLIGRTIEVYVDDIGDSQLVVNQVIKESNCHDAKMAAYCQEVRQLEDKFDSLELNHVPRHLNEVADALMKAVFGRESMPMRVFASDQRKPSVRYEESDQAKDGPSDPALRADPSTVPSDPEVMELEEDPAIEPNPSDDWRMPYLDYLLRDTLPTDRMEARWLARRAKSFVLVEGELYQRSHTRIL
ncbi:uncharacterized protein [Miscanthus floridulus]|uniref:uncharacterized protein n=1 Tax=Miscanthus floridulus TaxID=154761 RepID=UPI003458B5B2